MVGEQARRVARQWQTDAVLAVRRQAPWLLSSYADDVITVASSDNLDDTAEIDLRYPLADGRLLTEVPALCRTVREYIFWVRDDRYGRVDDAKTHAAMVAHLLLVVHGMTVREIWSFGDLQRSDIEEMAKACVGGIEALTESTRRIGEYLARFSKQRLPPVRIGRSGMLLDRARIVADCHLPSSVGLRPQTAHVLDTAAHMLGIGKQPDEAPQQKHLTSQNVRMYLAVFESLFEMRNAIEGEGLLFKPFKEGASSRAAQLGREPERTPIASPRLVLALLEGATRYICDQSEELLSVVGEATFLGMQRQQSLLRRKIQLLACACFVLILAFSARRSGEGLALHAGCLAGNDEHGWYLHVYISKNMRRMDWIPVPAIVARAVQVLIRLSERAREATGKQEIFQVLDAERGTAYPLKPTAWLNDLAAEVNVPPHKSATGVESVWKWQSRQLRRFFAVLYFYRYEGRIEVLSHHLRHFNLNLTRAYVTLDPEVAALWHQEEWGYQGHVARAIVASDRAYSGPMGKRLSGIARRLKDRFRKVLNVAPEEKAAEAIRTIIARKGLVLTPKKWVLCTCPGTEEGGTRAACRNGAEAGNVSGPDFANAGPTVCPACPWSMRTAANEDASVEVAAQLASAVGGSVRADTVFGEIERANLAKLERLNAAAAA